MSAIFPPEAQGGVPPGPEVCNGYTPTHPVSGGGPFYVAHDCTTTLTDCQMNGITSEILAAVDRLGFAYDSMRVTNLADALTALFNNLSTGKLNISGGTMTGPLILNADPTVPLGAATKQYVDAVSIDIDAELATKVNKAGDTMTGPLTLSGPPTAANHAATRAYVDAGDAAVQAQVTGRVNRAGDTMTGTLVLAGPPAAANDAATKGYVDAMAGAGTGIFLPLAGGAMTGPMTLAGPPTAPLNPVTLQFFNDQMSAAGLYPDAPNDGFAYGRQSQAWQRVVRLAGSTMTGPLILSTATPSAALEAAPKGYVDAQVTAQIGSKVNRAGDTMTGPLVLAGDPTAALQAAPRQYVDTRLIKTGDTMTGPLTMNVAAGNFAWNVNASKAYATGNGQGLFTSILDVKSNNGTDAHLRFLSAASTVNAEIVDVQSINSLVLRVGGGNTATLDSVGSLRLSGPANAGGVYLGTGSDAAAMFIEVVGGDFYIKANASYYFRYNAGNIYWWTPAGGGGGSYAFSADPAGNFYVRSQAYKPGGGPWTDPSDARIKDRVADYTTGLDAIRALRPVSYHFLPATGRDTERQYIGLVAQDAEPVMPECVSQQAVTLGDLQLDDMRVLDTGPIVFALINAVRELAEANDALAARVAKLEGRKR